MADPRIEREDAIARAAERIRDIVPCDLDYQQRTRITDVLSQVWDKAGGGTVPASDEERIRDAMTEAQDNPGRTVTR